MSYDSVVSGLSPKIFIKLNETSGTTADDIGSLNLDGTYVGSPALGYQSAIKGQSLAIKYDATNDEVTVPYTASGSTFSIVSIVKPASNSDVYSCSCQFPGSGGIPFALGMGASGSGSSVSTKFNLGVYSGSAWTVASSTTLVKPKTTVLGATITKNGTMAIFINGTKEATATAPNWSAYTGTYLRLGHRWDATTPAWGSGWQYGFALWETILSDSDMANIAAEVNTESTSYPETLEAISPTFLPPLRPFGEPAPSGGGGGGGGTPPTTGQIWPRGNW